VHCLHACLTSERACESRCYWYGASSYFVSLTVYRRTSRCFLHLGSMSDGGCACASSSAPRRVHAER
jgi:hypothetical protein